MEHLATVDRIPPVCSCYRDSNIYHWLNRADFSHYRWCPNIPSPRPSVKSNGPQCFAGNKIFRIKQPRTADIPRTNRHLRQPVTLFPQTQFEIEGFIFIRLIAREPLRRCCTAGCARRCSAALFPATGRVALKLSNNGTDRYLDSSGSTPLPAPCARWAFVIILRHRNPTATDQWAQDMFRRSKLC